jgi:hypothetical protein
MADDAFSDRSRLGGGNRLAGFRSGLNGKSPMSARRSAFRSTALPPEIFFVATLKALRKADLESVAHSLQHKSIFLDLGVLQGLTTFIVWMACGDTYDLFTNSPAGLNIANAAKQAAQELAIDGPVRMVFAYYNVKTEGSVC